MKNDIIVTYISEEDFTFSKKAKACMGLMSILYAFIIIGGLYLYISLDHSSDKTYPIFIMIYILTGLVEIYCIYITRKKYLNYEHIKCDGNNIFTGQTVLNHIVLFISSYISRIYPNLLSPHNVSNIFLCIGLAELVLIPIMILFVCGACCCVGYEELLTICAKGIDRGDFSDTDSDPDPDHDLRLQSLVRSTEAINAVSNSTTISTTSNVLQKV